MAEQYQWTVPCTICDSPVEYHCNTCGDVLCPRCKDMHLKSNAGRNHDVVPYSQRVKANQSSLQCGDHPGFKCGVWCQTCNNAVCGECVISPTHRGHHFLKFDEKIEERRKEIQEEFDKYSKILSDWKASLQKAEKMKEEYEENIEQIDREIVDIADSICKQVRAVARGRRKRLQEMKESSCEFLQDQQKMLTDGIQRLEKKLKELEDALRSNETSALLQCPVSDENVADASLPQLQAPATLVYAAGSLDLKILDDMFGSLSEEEIQGARSLSEEDTQGARSLSEEGIQGAMSELPQSKQMTLLPKPSVESVIVIEKDSYTPAIACIGSSQAWVQTAGERLQLLDRQGTLKRTINIDFYLPDMAVTPQGDILLSDYDNNCIRSISMGGDVKELRSTEWGPYGICSLPSGDVVVLFKDEKRVVQYSGTGEIIRELDRSLFQYPWYVAYSHVNQQLYVTDKSKPFHINASGKVLAHDIGGTLQYTYTGPDPTTFTPADVCTDSLGYVLITDYTNNRVHILDKGGNFLQYLLTGEQGLTKPSTIDVDSDGYAWIGENNTEQLKVVKYTVKK